MSWSRFAAVLLGGRVVWIPACLALVAWSVSTLPRVQFDLTIGPLLQTSDAQRQEVLHDYAAFSPISADVHVVLTWPHPLRGQSLDALGRLAHETRALPQVAGVLTANSARVVRQGSGLTVPVRLRELVGEGEVLSVVKGHPLLAGRLLSRDGRSAVLMVVADRADGGGAGPLLERLESFIPAHLPAGVTARFVGRPAVTRSIKRHMRRDMVRSVGLEVLILLFVLPLLFRTARGSVLPLAVVLAAIALNFGFIVWMGLEISLIGLAVPGLIMVIGLCDTVHMMERFEEALTDGADRRGAIEQMLSNVGTACFYTSFTTGLGFISLLAAEHSAVRQFGVKAAIAVLITFACVIVLLPLGLSVWPIRGARPRREALSRVLTYGRPRLTVLAFILLAAIGVMGSRRIVVDSRWLEELPRSDPAVEDIHWYEAHFGGFQPFEIRVEGRLDDPAVFRAVCRLEEQLIARDGVTGVESYTHWIREAVGNPAELTDAQIRQGVAALRLSGRSFPGNVLNRDWRQARMVFRTTDIGTRRYLGLEDELDQLALELPESVTARAAGLGRMAHRSSRLVATTILRSLGLSLVAICLFITLIYRSWRIGLISVVPNMLPILFALGLAGAPGKRNQDARSRYARPAPNKGGQKVGNGGVANAKHQYERYLALARSAASTGDTAEIENFYQHAEHYFRVMRERTA